VLVADSIFPFVLPVPMALLPGVRDWLTRFEETPVIAQREASADAALAWLCQSGLVLASARGRLDPAGVPPACSTASMAMQWIDHRTDVVCVS
jgi:hypothetical protein